MTVERIRGFRSRLPLKGGVVGAVLDFNGWQILPALRRVPALDYIWIDQEHGILDRDGAYKAVDAMGQMTAIPLVRASSTEPFLLKVTLELGACGIILPHIDTREQLDEAIQECLYPPAGRRSLGQNHAALQWRLSNDEYMKAANEHLVIVAQIEHVDALRHVQSICANERVDVIFIGRYDLSASLGYPGELEHPEVVRVEEAICSAARSAGKWLGTIVHHPDYFRRTVASGYNFILVPSLMNYMVSGLNAFLQEAGCLR